MKVIAPLVSILALCLAACTTSDSGTAPDPEKSCAERRTALLHGVTEYRDAHASQDPRIAILRPYPLVVEGLNGSGGNLANGDSIWIPPYGYDPVHEYFPAVADTVSSGTETAFPVLRPDVVSAIQIVSDRAYSAKVRISDSKDRLVRESTQTFGYRGELKNMNRVARDGLMSFLAWNGKDRTGALAPDGSYQWRITFTFNDGTQYAAVARTGLFKTLCPEM
jgi:hypothetical protein